MPFRQSWIWGDALHLAAQDKACTGDGGGELRGLRKYREEWWWSDWKSPVLDVQPRRRGGWELPETAEEGAAGDVPSQRLQTSAARKPT
jgi:hypothetical protein